MRPRPRAPSPPSAIISFERVRPIVEQALKENKRATWPIIVVHFDFKSVQPEPSTPSGPAREYEGWITHRRADRRPQSFVEVRAQTPPSSSPEDADEQGGRSLSSRCPPARTACLRLRPHRRRSGRHLEAREHLLATLPPEKLLTTRPTNYRRWWNNPGSKSKKAASTRPATDSPKTTAPARACRLRPSPGFLIASTPSMASSPAKIVAGATPTISAATKPRHSLEGRARCRRQSDRQQSVRGTRQGDEVE